MNIVARGKRKKRKQKERLKRQFFSVVVQQESLSVSYFCEILPKHGNRYKDMQIG